LYCSKENTMAPPLFSRPPSPISKLGGVYPGPQTEQQYCLHPTLKFGEGGGRGGGAQDKSITTNRKRANNMDIQSSKYCLIYAVTSSICYLRHLMARVLGKYIENNCLGDIFFEFQI
jgi:hypothetical protein